MFLSMPLEPPGARELQQVRQRLRHVLLRCHSFGGRVSVTAKAGVKEMIGRKGDQIGAMSGSCKLLKESLDPQIVAALNQQAWRWFLCRPLKS